MSKRGFIGWQTWVLMILLMPFGALGADDPQDSVEEDATKSYQPPAYELYRVHGVNSHHRHSYLASEGRFSTLNNQVFDKAMIDRVLSSPVRTPIEAVEAYELAHSWDFWSGRVDWHAIYFRERMSDREYEPDEPGYGDKYLPKPTTYEVQGVLVYEGERELRSIDEIATGRPGLPPVPPVIFEILIDPDLPSARQIQIFDQLIAKFLELHQRHAFVSANLKVAADSPWLGRLQDLGFLPDDDPSVRITGATALVRQRSLPGTRCPRSFVE